MRDYKIEHQIRKARQKRLLAEIDQETARMFLEHLKEKGLNYTAWLKKHINDELKEL